MLVSFNYDLLLETALDAVGTPYRRFPTRLSEISPGYGTVDMEAEGREVLLLKPHGSLDWVDRAAFERQLAHMREAQGEDGVRFSRDRSLLFGPNRCSTTRPLLEGPQHDDDPLRLVEVVKDVAAYYETFMVAFFHPPLILAPSQAKQLYGSALRKLWRGLAQHGYGWGGMAVIGYSMPPADPNTRLVLYRIVQGYVYGRENPDWQIGPMSPICLVDRRSSDSARSTLLDAYRFLPEGHTTLRLEGFGEEVLDDLFSDEKSAAEAGSPRD